MVLPEASRSTGWVPRYIVTTTSRPPDDLVDNERFVSAYRSVLSSLHAKGARATLEDLDGRYAIPGLWDKQRQTIVSNDSGEIMRMFGPAFDGLGALFSG